MQETWSEVVATALDEQASPWERVEAAAALAMFAKYLDLCIGTGFDGLIVDVEAYRGGGEQ